jgi:hypothetical protein
MQLPDEHSAPIVQDAPFVLMHVPLKPGTSHALPAGHIAEPQQTPSTQLRPLPQLASVAHAPPRPVAGTHALAVQTKPFAQSASAAQIDLHDAVSHVNPPHAFGTSLHLPVPSQVLAWVSTPIVHEFALHGVPTAA